MQVGIISKKSKKPRESGYYWVKWSGIVHNAPGVWRMGLYWDTSQTWSLMGVERVFYDSNFIEINENRIPPHTWYCCSPFLYWAVVLTILFDVAVLILFILNTISE